MNWDALGALAELGGAVAVVATLIYIARQVVQAKDVARTNLRMERLSGIREIFGRFAESPPLADAWIKAENNLGGHPLLAVRCKLEQEAGLSPAEAQQVSGFFMTLSWQHRVVWSEELNAEDRESLERNIKAFYSSAVGQLVVDDLDDATPFGRRVRELIS
jgi:hypothetical protein